MQVDAGAHDVGVELHAVDVDLGLCAEIHVHVFDLGAEIVVEGVFDAGARGPAEAGLCVGNGHRRADAARGRRRIRRHAADGGAVEQRMIPHPADADARRIEPVKLRAQRERRGANVWRCIASSSQALRPTCRERGGLIKLPPPPKPAAPFAAGDQLRIRSGPFAGLHGLYAGMAPRERIFVLLHMLGGERTVELAKGDVLKIGKMT